MTETNTILVRFFEASRSNYEQAEEPIYSSDLFTTKEDAIESLWRTFKWEFESYEIDAEKLPSREDFADDVESFAGYENADWPDIGCFRVTKHCIAVDIKTGKPVGHRESSLCSTHRTL